MKPPNDNAFKQPQDLAQLVIEADPHAISLNFRALGIEDQQQDARGQLEHSVEEKLDALSASELHEPRAYTKLFSPFTTYARSLVDAHAAVLISERPDFEYARDRTLWFRGKLMNHIAPALDSESPLRGPELRLGSDETSLDYTRFTRAEAYKAIRAAEDCYRIDWVFDEETGVCLGKGEALVERIEDRFRPDCLWEEVVSGCVRPYLVREKLPEDYVFSFVYIIRDEASSAQEYLSQELGARVKLPTLKALRPWERVKPPERTVVQDVGSKTEQKHGPESDAEGFRKTYEITEAEKFQPWTKHLRKVCEALDDAGVKRNKKGGEEVTWIESYQDRKNWDALKAAIRRRRKQHLDALSQTVS